MKIVRWLLALVVTVIIQFVVSTIIYNLQHLFGIFNIIIIFIRHFLSVFIGVNIGLLIAPKGSISKAKVFMVFYSILIIMIVINLFISKAESMRIASATIECFGIIFGVIAGTRLLKFKKGLKSFELTKVKEGDEFLEITKQIKIELKFAREQCFAGLMFALKKIDKEFAKVKLVLEEGSETDCVLIGYQLCCVIGFTLREHYIQPSQFRDFDKLVMDIVCKDKIEKCRAYHERYLDYKGDIVKIENAVTEDLIRSLSSLGDIGKYPSIRSCISPLGIISQAEISSIFGDEKVAKELKSKIRL